MKIKIILFITAAIFLLSFSKVEASHIQCGDTINQSTILDNDLLNCPLDGIVMNANDITLDCNGFYIKGTNSLRSSGVSSSNKNNLVIKNCNILNFNNGIKVYLSNDNTIIKNILTENDNGILLTSSQNNLLSDNIVNSNNIGIYLLSSNLNEGINNKIYLNDYGAYFISSDDNNISGNDVNSNSYYGIRLDFSKNNEVNNNTLAKNGNGISLSAHSNSNIVIKNNGFSNYQGISVYSSSENKIKDNDFSKNNFGIVMGAAQNNTISGNIMDSNLDANIYLYIFSASNLIYNNLFNKAKEAPYNAYDTGFNFWNIKREKGNNIIGGKIIAGNYWSDYIGEDLDRDGIGDTGTPYNSNGNILNGGDFLPLVMPVFSGSS